MPERLALLSKRLCFLPLRIDDDTRTHQCWMDTHPPLAVMMGRTPWEIASCLRASWPGVSLHLPKSTYRLGSGHEGSFGTSPPARLPWSWTVSFLSGWRPSISQSERRLEGTKVLPNPLHLRTILNRARLSYGNAYSPTTAQVAYRLQSNCGRALFMALKSLLNVQYAGSSLSKR